MITKPQLPIRLIATVVLTLLACAAHGNEGPKITFLAGDAAKATIVDEKVEPYFSLLCLHEMEVKSGVKLKGNSLDEQRAAFKRHYADNVSTFSAAEKAMLTEVIGHVHRALVQDYPQFTAYPWSLLKITDKVEQGLPHTRSKTILLPEGFLDQFVQLYQAKPDRVLAFLVNLMIHEQLHVVQRIKPKPFAAFYTEQWKLKHVDSIAYGEWLKDRQLINPDGVDTRWVQNIGTADAPRYIQPNIIIKRYEDRPSRMPGDFKQVAVELKKGKDGTWRPVKGEDGLPVVLPLHKVSGYMAHYGGSENVYHPNESFADLFAMAVIFDDFLPADAIDKQQRAQMNKTLDPVRAFMRQSFGPAKNKQD